MVSSWTRLRAAVDPLARRVNAYTAYTIAHAEFIGWADVTVDEYRHVLVNQGYAPQWLSAAKRHPDDGALHDLSYRRVPDAHPDAVTGTDLARWRPQDCQYHVHVFARPQGVDVYSHYELRPDFLRPRPDLRRLVTHYRPTYGESYLQGVTDLTV